VRKTTAAEEKAGILVKGQVEERLSWRTASEGGPYNGKNNP